MKVSFCFKEKLLALNGRFSLCYHKGFLIVKSREFSVIKKIRIHKWWESLVLVERLFRKEPRLAVSVSDDSFLYSDNGYLYLLNAKTYEVKRVFKYLRGMNNPLSFCLRKDKNGKIVEVLFGEYIWNEERGPVSIYKYDFERVEPVYTFDAGRIKHIHNIVIDDFNSRYLILTGDGDSESVIWESSFDFSSVKQIIGGKQMFRACVCLPTKDSIYYATDTPLEENHIFRIEGSKVIDVKTINGPCIYGLVNEGCLYFATSVEGDPTIGKLRYRLSNKLGKGVKSRFVHIMRLKSTGEIEKICEFEKDWLPMWLFQFGNAQFTNTDGCVFFTTQSTKRKGTYLITE